NAPSFGRPRCDITMTAACCSSAILKVGSAASMRASLVTRPSLTGTLRSSRISTRLPRKSRSLIRTTLSAIVLPQKSGSDPIFKLLRVCPYFLELAEQDRDVEHAVREAPLVVVPRARLHEL